MLNKKYKFATNALAGLAFAGLLAFNTSTLLQKNSVENGTQSVAGLLANASADEENSGGGGDKGKECGKDACEVTLGVGGTAVTAHGNYWHCQTVQDKTKSCTSSSCDQACDAKIIPW